MKKYKVGLVCPYSFSYPGGIQEHVRALYGYLVGKGIEVKVLVPRQSVDENYGKDVLLLGGCWALPVFGSKTNFSFGDSDSIEQCLSRENFDLLHFHNPFAPLFSWQLLENFDGKIVATLHADVSSEMRGLFPYILDFLNLTLAPKISKFIYVSDVARAVLWPKFIKYTVKIPNGVDTTRFYPRGNTADSGKIKILYVGRLDERKGLPYLLSAYKMLEKEFNNIELFVVGGGELRKKFQDQVEKEMVKGVSFLGYVTSTDLPTIYREADIFCSPAIYGESFGIVLVEAMASGLPVVAFNNNGYKEVLVGKGSELLVDVRDTEDLYRKLKDLVVSQVTREEYSKWGLSEVKKYSWESVGKSIIDVYTEIMIGK